MTGNLGKEADFKKSKMGIQDELSYRFVGIMWFILIVLIIVTIYVFYFQPLHSDPTKPHQHIGKSRVHE